MPGPRQFKGYSPTMPKGLTTLALPKLSLPSLAPPSLTAPTSAPVVVAPKVKPPKLSVEQLNSMGDEAIKQHLDKVMQPEDTRPVWLKVLDVLDVPRNVVGNVIGSIVGVDKSQLPKGTFGMPKVFMSDVLGKLGMAPGPLRAITGFVGDWFVNPLTWASASGKVGSLVGAGLPKVIGEGQAGLKALGAAERAGVAAAKAGGPVAAGTAAAEAASRAPRAVSGALEAAGMGAEAAAQPARVVGKLMGIRESARAALRGGSEATTAVGSVKKAGELAEQAAIAAGKTAEQAAALGKAARVYRLREIAQKLELVRPIASRRGGLVQSRIAEAVRPAAAAAKEVTGAVRPAAEVGGVLTGAPGAARRFAQPVEAAVKWLKKYGLRGRPLWAMPFTGGRVASRIALPFGKQARNWAGLASQTTEAGRAGVATISGFDAAYQGAVRTAKAAYTEHEAAQRALQAAQESASPGLPFAMAPAGMPAAPTMTPRLAAAAVRAERAAAAATEARDALIAAKNQLTAAVTSPEAPGTLARFMRGQIGPYATPGKPGIVSWLIEMKRKLVGGPPTPLRQNLVGVEHTMGIGRNTAEAKIGLEVDKAVRELAGNLTRDPEIVRRFGTEAALREALYRIHEVGLNPEVGMARFAPGLPGPAGEAWLGGEDVVRRAYRQAEPLIRNPAVQESITGLKGRLSKMLAERQAMGLPVPKTTEFTPSFTHPSARRFMDIQREMVGRQPNRTLGEMIARGKIEEYAKPGADPVRVLTTQHDYPEIVAGLRANEYKLGSTYDISRAQWNQWSAQGKLARLLGPARADVAQYRGPLFVEDLALAHGGEAGTHEALRGASEMERLVRGYGASIPQAEMHLYPNMSVVKPPPAGSPFAKLAQTGLYDRAYPRQVAEAINRMTEVTSSPREVQGVLRATDFMLNQWKRFQLFHPAYVIRNAFQNVVGITMAGGNPMRAVQYATDKGVRTVSQAVRQANPQLAAGIVIRVGDTDIPGEMLYQWAKDWHLSGAGFTGAQIKPALMGVMEPPTNVAGRAAATLRPASQLAGRAMNVVRIGNQALEDNMKIGAFLDFLHGGLSPQDAVMQTLKAMPDLSDVTQFERAGMARLFPWYRWMRRNGALQLFEHLPNNPQYVAMLPHFKNVLEGLRGNKSVPEELRPQWMREQAGAQMTGNQQAGTAFLPMNWTPFEETYQAMALPAYPGETARRAVAATRPDIRWLYELGTGVNPFRGEAYPKGTGYSSLELAAAAPKALQGRSGTPMDTLLALRPAREWGPGGRVAAMEGPLAKLGRIVFGGATQPVNLQKGLAAESFRLREQALRIRQEINRAMQANDQDLANSKMVQLMQVFKRMYELNLPGVPKQLSAALAQKVPMQEYARAGK